MNIFSQNRLMFIATLFAGIIFQGYKPVGPEQKNYKSLTEKKRLFKNVGCQYSNDLKVQYPEFDKLEHKNSSLYAYDPERYEVYAQRYAQDVHVKHHAPMVLRWISDVVGYGVFAGKNIKKGDFIGEYSGVLREVKRAGDNLDYAWYYSLDGIGGKKLVVDGKKQGNELRFINHANNPNTIRIDVLGKDGIFHVVYIASKDIKKDEQLTVSYGEGYFTSRNMKVVEA